MAYPLLPGVLYYNVNRKGSLGFSQLINGSRACAGRLGTQISLVTVHSSAEPFQQAQRRQQYVTTLMID